MPRPLSARIVCWLHTPYRRKDGRLVYRIRYRLPQPNGRRKLVQENVPAEVAWTGRHRNRATAWMLERQAELNTTSANPGRNVTLGQARNRYIKHMTPRWRERTRVENESILRQFVEYVGEDVPLLNVTGRTVADYLDGRLSGSIEPERTFRPATYKKHLGTLRHFFGRLTDAFDLLSRNPALGIEVPEIEPLPKSVLTDAECAALVAEVLKADPVHGLAVWTLAETGARVTEILTREWEDIALADLPEDAPRQAYILLGRADTKGRKARIPPLLSPELTLELDRYRKRLLLCGRLAGFVFRPWREQGLQQWGQDCTDWSARLLRKAIRGACKARKLPEIKPHDLRRAVATSAEELNVPTESVQEAVGWSGQRVIDQHYLARRALQHRAIKHAKAVSDARRFGTQVAKAGA